MAHFFAFMLAQYFGKQATDVYPAPLTKHQLWTVSLSAMFLERFPGGSHDTMYPFVRINPAAAKTILDQTWEVSTREQLMATLDALRASGHSAQMESVLGHRPWAWDVARYVSTVRCGFAAGLITEPEAWQLLAKTPPVAHVYDSWKSYARDFMLGRQTWLGAPQVNPEEFANQDEMGQAISHLLDPANAQSPWQRVPWQAMHQPDGPLEPNSADIVTIQTKV